MGHDRSSAEQRPRPGPPPAPSLEDLEQLFALAPDMLCVAGLDGYFKLVNPAFTAVLGYDQEELLARPFTEFIHPDDVESTRAAVLRVKEVGPVTDFENRYRRKDGTYAWFQWGARAGQHGLLYCVARELTEQRRLQSLLEETQKTAHIGAWELDLRTQELYWTDETYRIHETTPEEYTPDVESAIEFYTPESRPIIAEMVRQSGLTGEPWDLELQVDTAKGRRLDVRAVGRVEITDGVPIRTYGAFQDITDKKRTESAGLRRLRIIEATTDFVGTCEPDGRPIYLNLALRERLGLPSSGPIPQLHVLEFHPESFHERLAAGLAHAAAEGLWTGEAAITDHAGNEVPVSQVIMAHKNERGEVDFFSTIMRDLTERLQLEEQLLHSQKLEGIGRLAGGVAHDFNNLLTVIVGNAGLLREMSGLDRVAEACVAAVEQAAEQASKVTGQLLAFARKQIRDPRILDLSERVRTLVPVLDRLLGEGIHLRVELEPECWPVLMDPGHFEQVLVNLTVNASDAMAAEDGMSRGGDLDILTHNVRLTGEGTQGTPAGDFVELLVRDSGMGIDPELMGNLFEPFFTTKGQGKGTGLGLATCHGIVTQNGGHIRVESRLGEGTEFHLYFPRADSAVAVVAESEALEPQAAVRGGNETLLVVEDEPQVRDVAVRALEQMGYQVLAAECGQDALNLAKSHAGPIHGVVTDVIMPGCNGRQVVADLRGLLGPVPALYVSGYPGDRIDEEGILLEGARLVQKPFTATELARAVRGMLDH